MNTHFPLSSVSLPSLSVTKGCFQMGSPGRRLFSHRTASVLSQWLPTAWVPGHGHAQREAPKGTPSLSFQRSFLKLMLHQNTRHLARLRKRLLGVHLGLHTLAAIYRLQTTCWITCCAAEQVRAPCGGPGLSGTGPSDDAHFKGDTSQNSLAKDHSARLPVL